MNDDWEIERRHGKKQRKESLKKEKIRRLRAFINLADTKDHKLVILVRILCLQRMVYGGLNRSHRK